ncbi:MAG: Shedu anti-phage system protein SduA domain-containing protein, partial [Sphaerospermopsis kisseleviana]
ENPWMFGSEYSAILDRRTWTRDEQQDFVVRRTTDNYMEIIEIKTPLEGKPLFIYDKSHKSYYPAVELSKVIGQVQNYLEKLDGDRNSILANDGEDTNKIRAKIIIGRDGDKDQQKALRRLNGHLYRIEIITFDQLLRIAQNVLNYLQGIFIPRN